MRFTTNAAADPEVYKHLMTYETDLTVPKDIKEKAAKF